LIIIIGNTLVIDFRVGKTLNM